MLLAPPAILREPVHTQQSLRKFHRGQSPVSGAPAHLDLLLWMRFSGWASAMSTSPPAGAADWSRVRLRPRLWERARSRACVGSMPTRERDACRDRQCYSDGGAYQQQDHSTGYAATSFHSMTLSVQQQRAAVEPAKHLWQEGSQPAAGAGSWSMQSAFSRRV